MNVSFDHLHKAFESRIRLGIMSILSVNDKLDYTALREYLDVTDGNLATHLKKLENELFIDKEKSFIDAKPNTKYFITNKGRQAFEQHLSILEKIIKAQK